MLHVSSWKETPSEAPFQNVIIVIKFEKLYSTATEKHCTEIRKTGIIICCVVVTILRVEYFLTLSKFYKTTFVGLFSIKVDPLLFSLAICETWWEFTDIILFAFINSFPCSWV